MLRSVSSFFVILPDIRTQTECRAFLAAEPRSNKLNPPCRGCGQNLFQSFAEFKICILLLVYCHLFQESKINILNLINVKCYSLAKVWPNPPPNYRAVVRALTLTNRALIIRFPARSPSESPKRGLQIIFPTFTKCRMHITRRKFLSTGRLVVQFQLLHPVFEATGMVWQPKSLRCYLQGGPTEFKTGN